MHPRGVGVTFLFFPRGVSLHRPANFNCYILVYKGLKGGRRTAPVVRNRLCNMSGCHLAVKGPGSSGVADTCHITNVQGVSDPTTPAPKLPLVRLFQVLSIAGKPTPCADEPGVGADRRRQGGRHRGTGGDAPHQAAQHLTLPTISKHHSPKGMHTPDSPASTVACVMYKCVALKMKQNAAPQTTFANLYRCTF